MPPNTVSPNAKASLGGAPGYLRLLVRVPFAAALLQAITVAVHLQNMHMVSEPVQQGAGESLDATAFRGQL